jgi:dephospho-CoA kinase
VLVEQHGKAVGFLPRGAPEADEVEAKEAADPPLALRAEPAPEAKEVEDPAPPLLVESDGWLDRVDRVLVIDCSEQTQIDRVVTRSGWSADTARSVMSAQSSRAERLRCADDVIVNDGLSIVELAGAVDALWAQWKQRISASL